MLGAALQTVVCVLQTALGYRQCTSKAQSLESENTSPSSWASRSGGLSSLENTRWTVVEMCRLVDWWPKERVKQDWKQLETQSIEWCVFPLSHIGPLQATYPQKMKQVDHCIVAVWSNWQSNPWTIMCQHILGSSRVISLDVRCGNTWTIDWLVLRRGPTHL